MLPGAIDTPMLWDNPNVKSGAEKVDPSMVGKPEDIAAAIAFLASDDAAFVTGTALRWTAAGSTGSNLVWCEATPGRDLLSPPRCSGHALWRPHRESAAS